jgi:hypothetical protein
MIVRLRKDPDWHSLRVFMISNCQQSLSVRDAGFSNALRATNIHFGQKVADAEIGPKRNSVGPGRSRYGDLR